MAERQKRHPVYVNFVSKDFLLRESDQYGATPVGPGKDAGL